MKFCEYCGKQIADEAKFCPYCGHKVRNLEDLSKEEQPKEQVVKVSENKAPEEKTNTQIEQSTAAGPTPNAEAIEEVAFFEKVASEQKVNLMIKIYSIVTLVFAGILFAIGKNATNIGISILKSDEGYQTLIGVLRMMQIFPFIYYVLMLFAMVILAFAIYRFLRNFNGKLYLIYSIGLDISIVLMLCLRSAFDLLQLAGKYAAEIQTGDAESLLSNDYTEVLTDVKSIMSSVSSYKVIVVIFLIVTVALLVVAILSNMQLTKENVAISPLIAMNADHTFNAEGTVANKDVAPFLFVKMVRIIVVIVLVISCGAVWATYYNYTSVNVLKNVKLSYDGVSGDATAKVQSNKIAYNGDDQDVKDFLNSITYSLSENSNISNGDTITVTAEYDQSKAKSLKLKLTDTTKNITVRNLAHRYDDVSDIPSEMFTELYNRADDIMNNDAYKDVENNDYDLTFARAFFVKDDDSDTGDCFVSCYKVVDTYDDGTSGSFYAYTYVFDLNSSYTDDSPNWRYDYFGDYNVSVSSDDDLQSGIAQIFEVDENQVQSF